MKLKLNNGEFALIDKEDFERVSKFNWGISKRKNYNYVVRWDFINGKRKAVYLHRFIMNCPKGMVVDHIFGDTFDNRKSKMRICTHQQNGFNQKTQTRKKSSIYKGVHWNERGQIWISSTKLNKKYVYIGSFKKEKDAARAYNKKVKELFGVFSCLNLI